MDATVVLVHSPLVGPSSWRAAGHVLAERGFEVVVPDLTGVAAAPSPRWRALVGAAVAGIEVAAPAGPVVVVGHSGAGVFLPGIGSLVLGRLAGLVFVDAVVPAVGGVHRTPARQAEMLDQQAVTGILRPWLQWWPDDIVAELLPDAGDRQVLLADMPRLPRAFYDEEVPLPDGWSTWPCAYLRLSAAYDADHAEADSRGWPRASIDADHLAIHTRADVVIDAILSLVEELTA